MRVSRLMPKNVNLWLNYLTQVTSSPDHGTNPNWAVSALP